MPTYCPSFCVNTHTHSCIQSSFVPPELELSSRSATKHTIINIKVLENITTLLLSVLLGVCTTLMLVLTYSVYDLYYLIRVPTWL